GRPPATVARRRWQDRFVGMVAGAQASVMNAWSVRRPGPMSGHPLVRVTKPVPVPAEHELLIRVSACGVCRTDLHVTEGDLPVHLAGVTPGHEIVGHVSEIGPSVADFRT